MSTQNKDELFHDVFEKFEEELPGLLDQFSSVSDDDVINALKNPNPSIHDFLALISPKAENHLEAIAQKSQAITWDRFGRAIQLYAPLYFSSECSNKCDYCSFSMDNDIVRKTLNQEELKNECQYLSRQGFDHMLLVAGEDNRTITTDYIKECITTSKDHFSSVTIEIAPQDTAKYKMLADAGCEGVTIYQETYDRENYKIHHVAGKKRIFKYRLNTPDRACEAGMRNVSIGALFGLSNWKLEALSIFKHLQYLHKKYWRTQFSIGMPRLKPYIGEYEPENDCLLEDTQMVQIICAIRICFPDAGIVLSTREPAEFRDNVFPLGVTKMSAGSSTEVGGYTGDIPPNEPQFSIDDLRSPQQFAKDLKDLGYDPVWKDWEGVMHAL